MPVEKVRLDDIQHAQLVAFASVNNMSIEEALAFIFTQHINQKMDILLPLDVLVGSNNKQH